MDDFSLCMVSNTRMAARAITRRYDALARPFGITATQFSLLGTLVASGAQSISELAERRGFERTTLTRNLALLERLGLIESRPAERGNGRVCDLSSKGREMLGELLPVWRRAQAEIRAELGEAGFDEAVATLKRIAAI